MTHRVFLWKRNQFCSTSSYTRVVLWETCKALTSIRCVSTKMSGINCWNVFAVSFWKSINWLITNLEWKWIPNLRARDSKSLVDEWMRLKPRNYIVTMRSWLETLTADLRLSWLDWAQSHQVIPLSKSYSRSCDTSTTRLRIKLDILCFTETYTASLLFKISGFHRLLYKSLLVSSIAESELRSFGRLGWSRE